MLGKLKEAAGGAALQKVVGAVAPALTPHLDKLSQLSPDLVRNDDSFKDKVIAPALLAIAGSTAGATALIPKFNEKFTQAMLHLRDELVVFEGDRISLVEGFQERLPSVLMAGLK
jgi:hypothetical protein